MLIGVVAVLKAALGVLGISKRVRGITVEWVVLWLCTSLQVEVLGGGEVSKGGGEA